MNQSSNKKTVVPECKASINHSDNKESYPQISLGKVIANVPVILAAVTVQVNIDTKITFPEPVLEIKDIKKRVKLTRCLLLLPTNKLFVKGVVRKNIQYASPSRDIAESTATSVASDIHSYTVDIPFECVTEIQKYLTNPVMPEINSRQEFDFFVTKPVSNGFPEKDEFLSSDLSQFHQESTQFYNELPFCELVSSHIIEWDESTDRIPLPYAAPLDEGFFSTVAEKMVLDLTINVLQKQQIRVSSATNDENYQDCDCQYDCDCS